MVKSWPCMIKCINQIQDFLIQRESGESGYNAEKAKSKERVSQRELSRS